MKERNFLTNEIHELVTQYMEVKEPLDLDILSNEICSRHRHEIVDDAEWTRFVVFNHVRQAVGKVVSKMIDSPMDVDPSQLVLGFECLQKYYPVERDGRKIGLPVDDCEDFELNAIAERFEKNAVTLNKHAKEIREYVKKRVLTK